MLLYNGHYIYRQFQYVKPFHYIFGEFSRDQYIQQFRPEYASITFANSTLNRSDKVLCLFLGKRGYYMEFTPVFDMPYSGTGILSDSLETTGSSASLSSSLLSENIRYILLREDLTLKWLNEISTTKSRVFRNLIVESTILFKSNGYMLVKIES